MSITHESAFEANIEAHLLGHGWHTLAPAAYDRKAGCPPRAKMRLSRAPCEDFETGLGRRL